MSERQPHKLIVILGTNASGKSGLGIELALKFGAEIVSADSRQVYKGLDLGSGKVTEEEMKAVLKPELYTGRCAEQVERYVRKLAPVIAQAGETDGEISV